MRRNGEKGRGERGTEENKNMTSENGSTQFPYIISSVDMALCVSIAIGGMFFKSPQHCSQRTRWKLKIG